MARTTLDQRDSDEGSIGEGLVALGSERDREKILSGDDSFSKTFAPEQLIQPDQALLPPGMSVTID